MLVNSSFKTRLLAKCILRQVHVISLFEMRKRRKDVRVQVTMALFMFHIYVFVYMIVMTNVRRISGNTVDVQAFTSNTDLDVYVKH